MNYQGKVAFRVDAAHHIGSGHYLRCIKLARHLKRKNIQSIFFSRKHKLFEVRDLLKDEFELFYIGKSSEIQSTDDTQWLGVSQSYDFKEFLSTTIKNKVDFDALIIDHYSLDFEWHKMFSKVFGKKKIMVIDDLANKKYFSDIILNPNLRKMNYEKLNLKEKVKLFLGSPYIFIERDKLLKVKKAKASNVVGAFFGYGCSKDFIEKFVKAYKNIEFFNSYQLVVITRYFQELDEVKQVEFVGFQEDFLSFIGNCDMFIGAAGTSSYERFMLNVPSILFSLADNQKPFLNYFKVNNLAYTYDDVENFKNSLFSYRDYELLKSYTENARKIISNADISEIAAVVEGNLL